MQEPDPADRALRWALQAWHHFLGCSGPFGFGARGSFGLSAPSAHAAAEHIPSSLRSPGRSSGARSVSVRSSGRGRLNSVLGVSGNGSVVELRLSRAINAGRATLYGAWEALRPPSGTDLPWRVTRSCPTQARFLGDRREVVLVLAPGGHALSVFVADSALQSAVQGFTLCKTLPGDTAASCVHDEVRRANGRPDGSADDR